MNCFDELSLVLAIDRMESSEKKVFKFFFIFTEKAGGRGFLREYPSPYGKRRPSFPRKI